jgi:arylsulfatase A
MYMPPARGFDEYLGLPASQDMGLTLWETKDWKPSGVFQPAPIALFNGTTIIEQPVDLGILNERYANFSMDFIRRQTAADKPFYLYVAFNHVHAPSSAGPAFCGSSKQGPVGDAMQELDHAVGQIMTAAAASGADILTFLLSDNGAPIGTDRNGNKP